MSDRLGFYYFADTLHYRQRDLETWLPVLHSLGAAWLTVLAPSRRAIPEAFIRGLLDAGIQPVLHFADLPLGAGAALVDELRPLVHAYADWGVRHVAWFDRPNQRWAWKTGWQQTDLAGQFLESFWPLAQLAVQAGLCALLPPLEPGGDYWDTAFLRQALKRLSQRWPAGIVERLGLSAYAWVHPHGLEWGAGGPRRWPQARPYACPPGAQDQRGLRIFEWYCAIAQEELGRSLPVVLLRAGQPFQQDVRVPAPEAQVRHASIHQDLARWLDGEDAAAAPGQELLACNVWLLAAEAADPYAAQAWYVPGREPRPAAAALQQWAQLRRRPALDRPHSLGLPGLDRAAAVDHSPLAQMLRAALSSDPPEEELPGWSETAAWTPAAVPAPPAERPAIAHYVLLPLYAWGAASWDLGLIEPMLRQAHPTIGFSLAEARYARRVTVVGGQGAVSAEAVAMLRRSGCQVERILEDGTLLASESL